MSGAYSLKAEDLASRDAGNGLAARLLLSLAQIAVLPALLAQTNPPVPVDGSLSTPHRIEIVASRLQAPWSVVFTPDNRIFFSERPGWVRVIQGGKVLPEPALLLTNVVASVKMGLLGLAVHPGFRTNHFLYAAYNYEIANETYRLRIVRFRESGNRLIEPHTLLEDIPAYRNHTGCRLRFGPEGCLYITTGDANDPPLSQRLDSPAGKILRLNPDGSVPKDNPFVGRSNALASIWSYGHRNPQGLDFHPKTGALYASEHGPDHGDEINVISRGDNYGWPGIHHRQSGSGMQSPLLEFTPAIGPAGTVFCAGSAFPELTGNLLVGCLRGEGILRIGFEGTKVVLCERLLHFKYGRIREVAEGPDGCIYFTTSQFDPPEGTPRPEYDFILRLVPTSFSESGLPLAIEWNAPRAGEQPFDAGTTNATGLIGMYCAPCHGPGLRGGMQKAIISPDQRWSAEGQRLRITVKEGLANKGMPAFEAALKEEQIAALVDYIQTTDPNSRPDPASSPR